MTTVEVDSCFQCALRDCRGREGGTYLRDRCPFTQRDNLPLEGFPEDCPLLEGEVTVRLTFHGPIRAPDGSTGPTGPTGPTTGS